MCALTVVTCVSPTAADAQDTAAKRVLLISTGSRLGPGFVIVDQQILRVLHNRLSPPPEIYAENLDVFRFSPERSQKIFRDYLSEKYADAPPDLIILVFAGHAGIHAAVLEQLFPRSPIVLAGLSEEELRANQFGTAVSGVLQRTNPAATIELILRLQPEVRRVVVVGGTSQEDRQLLRRVEVASQSFKNRLDFDFWNNVSMATLRERAKTLPPNSAVLFTRMFQDAAGQVFVSSDVGRWLGEWASAPVYVLADSLVGSGAVGGSVASIEAFGQRAGELAERILSGVPPESLSFEISDTTVPMFDWRALERWHIDERRLPAGSVVRYKPPALWDEYRWHVLAALTIIVLQSLMIAALVIQRRHLSRLQLALEGNRELMDLAATAGELGLWSRHLTDDKLWANAPMRALFGFGANDPLRFGDFLARIHPDDRPGVFAQLERCEAAGLPLQTEYRIQRPDGTERWVLWKGRAINDLGDHESRRMGVVMDITERKKTEIELLEQRATMAHVARVAIVSELAVSLAHEINQPLTAIQSNAQAGLRLLSRESADKQELREVLNDIVQANTRAAEVIQHTRALLRKDKPLEFGSVDLLAAINDVIALVQIDAALQGVRISIKPEDNLQPARGDRVQLQQVVLNLILNALDAMETCPASERSVEVRITHESDGMLRIAISDRGSGFNSEELGRIFDPFYTTKREGLGMGLSISRSIIESHDGRLWAESNVGRGATFYFTVPTY
jgi:PAS domain S-box-containing protein